MAARSLSPPEVILSSSSSHSPNLQLPRSSHGLTLTFPQTNHISGSPDLPFLLSSSPTFLPKYPHPDVQLPPEIHNDPNGTSSLCSFLLCSWFSSLVRSHDLHYIHEGSFLLPRPSSHPLTCISDTVSDRSPLLLLLPANNCQMDSSKAFSGYPPPTEQSPVPVQHSRPFPLWPHTSVPESP